MNLKNILVIGILLGFLSACGGSEINQVEQDPAGEVIDDTGSVTDGFDEGGLTNVSYAPLMTLELYKDWSGYDQDNVFKTYFKDPFIKHYLINPVNATTLDPITTAQISDYTILEDAVPLNPKVNFPMLQKVLGNSIDLQTAIVINTSTSMDAVDKSAMIQEIKDFITLAKAHSDSGISSQRVTIWAYDGAVVTGDGGIVEETAGFKSIATEDTAIMSALDTVETKWAARSYSVAGANHTYDAVVEAVGRFVGKSPYSTDEDFLAGADNDLNETLTPDSLAVSNVILVSAGVGDTGRFDPEYFVKALQSQAVLDYAPAALSTAAGENTELVEVGRPLIYILPDGEVADPIVESYAYATIEDTVTGGNYNFAGEIITEQLASINSRAIPGNQHVVRFASAFRVGENHETIFKTRTADDKYGYTLTASPITRASAAPMPSPTVEITGVNNEYLAAGVNADLTDYSTAIAFFDQIQTFYPATRWTNTEYTSSDYSWNANGADVTNNPDGSITVNAANTFPVTLTLTNTVINDDFTVTINASY